MSFQLFTSDSKYYRGTLGLAVNPCVNKDIPVIRFYTVVHSLRQLIYG